MNRYPILTFATLLTTILPAFAQGAPPSAPQTAPKKMFIVRHTESSRALDHQALLNQAASGATIPLWNYSVVAPVDGRTYTGTMVGRNPAFHGHRPTYITTYIVPVILTFAADGGVYDPTATNACLGDSVVNVTLHSPIFQNVSYSMNGVPIGTTQYVDAFQRANFWQNAQGTPWFTYLRPTVLPAVNVTVPANQGSSNSSAFDCQPYGTMDIDWWDNYLQSTLLPSLASQGVSSASFPIFLFDSVFEYQNGNPSDCCVLGYHSAYTNSSNTLQTYSISSWDNSGAFGGDISISSHEIAEWMDDPTTNNPTPAWGHTGQVSGCQGNLEVGDPLTGTEWGTVTLNNYTYTLQELAFFSWFFRQSPSLGAGGFYSNDQTFNASAGAICH